MILHGARTGRIVTCVLVGIGLFALGAAVAGDTAGDEEQQAARSKERLAALMTERCDILKHIVDLVEKHLASGRATLAEWRDAKVALYVAQTELSTDRAGQITIHEEMVDFLKRCEQLAQRSADAGQTPQVEVDRARVATIDAQIALERLRLRRP
ncbi:MAG: hypothetical protein ABFE13_22385 [Phycisphaerales bacterium]